MANIDVKPIIDAVAAGVAQALAANPGGAVSPAGAPVVFEVFDPKTGKPTQIWAMAGNVLWRSDDVGNLIEANGWHRVKIPERDMFILAARYAQIVRMDLNFSRYEYDKPAAT